ncbi:O-Antigen ligase [Novipirellula aureliae]|uniref:O-Antigen ligase n=1 Tax=Novipirellula aureliae TaxID=2527966 RepID=A0A5C6DLE7_9BACT|nr:O-antigen ligase family protein [Novipirellula aureliae]TWU37598.1 O-Antigen ligase [Novipirellula aureliae]
MLRVAEPARTLKPRTIGTDSQRESVWKRGLTHVGRALMLGAFAYGTWLNGAMQPDTLRNISIVLCIAFFCAAVANYRTEEKRPIPRTLFVLALLWILYGGIQLLPVPWASNWYFQGPVAIHEQFTLPAEAELLPAIERISTSDPALESLSPSTTNASVAVEETRWALVPYLIGLAFAVLAAQLFQTSESRRILLWVLVANSTLLAIWGILQRAGGSVEILPGIRNTVPGIPFSSFAYKNAGAAAIMPAAAAALLLLAERRGSVRSQYRYKRSDEWLTPYSITLLICLGLIIIGVGVSLSRGAWAAALFACLVIAILRYKSLSRKVMYVAIALPICFLCITWVAKDVGESVGQRTSDLSFDVIAADSRWEHWKDGVQTAIAHFPSGSGLGTYGYATLSEQTQTHSTWFREAHNQFLEIGTESGLIGIVLLGLLMLWFLKQCIPSLRSDRSLETKAWASFGIALFCLLFVQSLADFVITIPTNLFVYAILVSVVASGLMTPISPMATRIPLETSDRWIQRCSHRSVWTIACVACLLWSISISSDQMIARQALAMTRITELDDSAQPQMIEERLTQLDEAIDHHPRSATLYERRAAWRLQQYRTELMDEIQRRGQSADWQSTDPINILNLLAAIPDEYHEQLLADFVSTEALRRPLSQMMADLYCSLAFNSLRPSAYYRSASIASITGMKRNVFLDRSIRLSNNDVDKLFRNGLVAFITKNDEQMIDQWTRSLSIEHRYIEPIISLACQRLEPMRVAKQLVPATRPDIFLRLAATPVAANENSKDQAEKLELDPLLAHEMIEYLLAAEEVGEEQIAEDKRFSVVAQFYEKLLDQENAVLYWEQAVAKKPRNIDYRIRYIQSLLRLGRFTEALNQATVGRTLHPIDTRFENLVEQARRGVSQQHPLYNPHDPQN